MNEVGMIRAKTIKAAALAFIGLALAACGGSSNANEAKADDEERGIVSRMFGASEDKRNPGPCPLIGVLYESSRLVEFRAPGERLANVGFTGEINGVRGLCAYSGAKPIDVNLEIEMSFGRGPMATEETRTYRYWVAVTRTNVGPITKEYFDVQVKFPRGASVVRHTEQIKRISIPRANADVAGTAFEVLVGFELTPEQLAFNRAGKRFRLDAGR